MRHLWGSASRGSVGEVWKNAWFSVGIAFALLGVGNWYTGLDKTHEYERLLKNNGQVAARNNFEEFSLLNEHTNLTLLRPLQRKGGAFTMVTGKLDFYRLVRTGGEIMILAGLFVAAAAAIHTAYHKTALRQRGLVKR